ncbi:retrotrans_gag domain-containing protein [Trichonephila clavipes]|nr:retrotrans_gag domain-containing protein [Trichonephila clavipes]
MKGVAGDIYQALLTREINDTTSFIKWCNYIEDMKQKRVGRPRFERLPNVITDLHLTDETDLVSLRTIAVFDRSPDRRRNFDDVGTEEEIRRPNSSRRLPVHRPIPIRRYRSPSPYRRSSQSPGRRSEKLKSDLQEKASQAVIDCGQNNLFYKTSVETPQRLTPGNLYATRDYTLKPHSLTRITVSGYQTRGDINVVLDGSKHLLFEKNIATPSMSTSHMRNGKSDVGLPTCSSKPNHP